MFEALLLKLSLIQNTELLTTFAVIVFFTCMSVIPNSNDLLLGAASLVIKAKGISLITFILVAFIAWGLGENFMFFFGHFAGKKLMKTSFIQKKINLETQHKIRNALNRNPSSIIFTLRMTPIMRPYLIATLGAAGLKPVTFLRLHLPLLFFYILLVATVFYFAGEFISRNLSAYKLPALLILLAAWLCSMIWAGKKSQLLNSFQGHS